METKIQKIDRIRNELVSMFSENLQDTKHTGVKETYLSHVAYACGELDAAINKLREDKK